MSAVFHRTPKQPPPKAVRGQGIYLYDEAGKAYLDGSGGAAVSCLGHGHPRVIEAIQRQVEQLAFAHTGFFTSEPAEALAEHIVQRAPPGLGKVYFLSGGSEATETALKLTRQYHLANREPERTVFVSRRQSYHGNTLGALGVSGNPGRRKPYEPLLTQGVQIAPCHEYRNRRDGESAAAYSERAAAELEESIVSVGAERVAAFIAEPVVGATLGAAPATPGYFQRIREICDRYGVLFIADEVMCGMGRTGSTFAIEHDGVAPDLITIAKGLGGGYQPIGAVVAKTSIHDAIVQRFGSFEHGHTYIGHPTACAAALAVQQTIEGEHLLEAVRARGDHLERRLRETFGQHPLVGDLRGRGLMRGVEIVADRDTKAPFPNNDRIAARVKAAAMERGLICYPGAGSADGVNGDHILLAPPFIISDTEIDDLIDKLAGALRDVLGEA